MKRQVSIAALKKRCWKLLSEYVRRRAAGPDGWARCYTCGNERHWKLMDAGHFVPGRTGSVLLNEEVLRVQCKECNLWRGGNYHAYTLRMIDEVGREKVEELLALKHKVRKWTREELMGFLDCYRERLRGLDRC